MSLQRAVRAVFWTVAALLAVAAFAAVSTIVDHTLGGVS